MAQVDRPVFVIGPPRSGTSLLYRVLSQHPDLGYITRASKRHPESPRLAQFLTRLGRFDDKPKEGNAIWNRFRDREADLMEASDATPETTEWFREFVAGHMAARGVGRFLAKCPRHAIRTGWLQAVFPDCRFVIIHRDWRAVVASTLLKRRRDAQDGKRWWGVHVPGWRKWLHEPAAVGAAAQFAWVHDYLADAESRFPGQVHRVWYEELCAGTEDTIRGILEHCDLPWSEEFARTLPTDLAARNDKWRDVIDAEEVDAIRARFADTLPHCEWPRPS